MIGLNDLQDLIGSTFFDGNEMIGGIVIYTVVLAVLFALSRRNTTQALILSLPATLVFTTLGILPTDLMILLVIVTVLGLAYTTRNIWRD